MIDTAQEYLFERQLLLFKGLQISPKCLGVEYTLDKARLTTMCVFVGRGKKGHWGGQLKVQQDVSVTKETADSET